MLAELFAHMRTDRFYSHWRRKLARRRLTQFRSGESRTVSQLVRRRRGLL